MALERRWEAWEGKDGFSPFSTVSYVSIFLTNRPPTIINSTRYCSQRVVVVVIHPCRRHYSHRRLVLLPWRRGCSYRPCDPTRNKTRPLRIERLVSHHLWTSQPWLCCAFTAKYKNQYDGGGLRHSSVIQNTPSVSLKKDAAVVVPRSLHRTRKPRGYWQDYSNVRREIIQYIQQRDGIAVSEENNNLCHYRMPSADELRRNGYYALVLAIHKHHGGFHRLASTIGLYSSRRSPSPSHVSSTSALSPCDASSQRKTPNKRQRYYWHPIDNLQKELVAFMQQNGIQHLPSSTLLTAAKRWDLMSAIRLHGGIYKVSRKTHLALSKNTPRPRGYWLNMKYLKKELKELMRHSCLSSMPTLSQLKKMQRQDLIEAIRKHGGIQLVASKLGIYRQSKRKPKGYWSNFAVLRGELSVFLRRYGTPGVMPLGHELRRHRRGDLCYAIQLHGGFSVVAGKLHLNWIGPLSFWKNRDNLRKRLFADMEKWGYHGMPTLNDLAMRGRVDLIFGIRYHQGFPAVAKAFGLELTIPSRPRLYWNDPENVVTELKELIALLSNEENKYMPSNETLYQLGRGDLADAIRDTKGWVYYAKRLLLPPRYRCVASSKLWKDIGFVRRQLQRYLAHRGLAPQQVASLEELYRDGRGDLAFAIMKYHQGATKLAQRLKWKAPHKRPLPAAYYRYWSNLVKQLFLWVDQYSIPGLMPSKKQLFETGYRDLVFVIYRHGGFHKVACRLGWIIVEDNPHWLTQWLASQAGYSMLRKPRRMKPFAKWMSFPDG